MAVDYGGAPERGRPRLLLLTAVVGAVLLAATFGYSWKVHREEAIADAAAWTITGPPCPSLSHQAFLATGLKAEHVFEYDDVTFTRGVGHTSCAVISANGGRGPGSFPVCQFTGPAAVVVTTKSGVFYFAPGYGHPITISVPNGHPQCVLKSNFTARGDST